jgi:hypothetical protein
LVTLTRNTQNDFNEGTSTSESRYKNDIEKADIKIKARAE